MKLMVINTPRGFVPYGDDDYEEKQKLKLGETYSVEIKVVRNLDFHRKYFALISYAWEFLTESETETFKTKENFSLQRMKGDNWKKEHVLDLPFSYFFPQRLCNPSLAEGQDWDVAVDENFLLVYNADFEPNSTYEVVLDLCAE